MSAVRLAPCKSHSLVVVRGAAVLPQPHRFPSAICERSLAPASKGREGGGVGETRVPAAAAENPQDPRKMRRRAQHEGIRGRCEARKMSMTHKEDAGEVLRPTLAKAPRHRSSLLARGVATMACDGHARPYERETRRSCGKSGGKQREKARGSAPRRSRRGGGGVGWGRHRTGRTEAPTAHGPMLPMEAPQSASTTPANSVALAAMRSKACGDGDGDGAGRGRVRRGKATTRARTTAAAHTTTAAAMTDDGQDEDDDEDDESSSPLGEKHRSASTPRNRSDGQPPGHTKTRVVNLWARRQGSRRGTRPRPSRSPGGAPCRGERRR